MICLLKYGKQIHNLNWNAISFAERIYMPLQYLDKALLSSSKQRCGMTGLFCPVDPAVLGNTPTIPLSELLP